VSLEKKFMVFEYDKELSEVSENMRLKKLPRGNGVDATSASEK